MGSRQDIIGQLWKEYALSDSRYMTADTLVLCMETITVVSSRFVPASFGCADSIAPLGPSLLLGGLFNLQPTCTPASIPDHCLHEPSVRRRSVLRDKSIWSLCPWGIVLSTGGILLLGLLFLDELHLDCDSVL